MNEPAYKENGIPDYAALWNFMKKTIVLAPPDKKKCTEWGRQILKAWKNAQRIEKRNEGYSEQINDVIQDLFSCAVFTKKPYSQKFNWIIESFLEEKPTKKMNAMFFNCTMPVVWRNLEVPNEELRLAASSIILNFFPLISDDEFIKEEYIAKQQNAMDAMLMDDCVPIRIMALKKVPEHLSKNWEIFQRELIKSYLEKIVDKLSLDSLPEVRAAVFEGMEYLLPCPDALTANQRSLEILAKRGINDKAEKVRLAAFRMLNKLHGHRYIKLLDLVTMDELLRRLDFEHSRNVQNQIVRLIFMPFIPGKVEGIDYQERFKRIYFMCKQSWNASRHFHHLIYPLGLIPIETAVHHIRCLLIGVKLILRKIAGNENADDTGGGEQLKFNLTGTSSDTEDQQMGGGGAEEKIKISKNVLDSAIILWMAIIYDLFEPKNAGLNAEVVKIMSNILEILNQFPNETTLMDSALVIAAHLPKDKIGRMFGRIKNKLEQEDTKHPQFSHYVEALAAWDMNKLIDIIEKGLKKLRNDLILVTDPSLQMSTPRRRLQTPLRGTDSPPSKKVKITNEFDELRRPLELIQILLASPLCSEELKSKFTIYLEGFYESLFIIRKHFAILLCQPAWEKKFNSNILYAAYETFNIIALVTKKIEGTRRTSNGEEEEINEVEMNLSVNDRLLYNEMKWFASIVQETTPSFQVIRMFLRCTDLHLTSGQLSGLVLNEVGNMLGEIMHMIEDAYDAGMVESSLKKTVLYLKESLESCEDVERAQRTIVNTVNPLLEFLEDTQLEGADEGYEEENTN